MVANVPVDILDRLRAVEDRLRQVEGRTQQRPALNQILGNVNVGPGGIFKVLDTDGSTIFWVGGISPAHPDGSPQRGVLMYREDGSIALQIATTTADPQGLAIRDRAGYFILADDVPSGSGLSAPHFGADGWYGYTETPAWTTTSASFATCMSLAWKRFHPRVQGFYLVRCDAGVSGEIRLVDGAGGVIGTVALGAGAYQVGSVTGPISGGLGSDQTLTWQARVTGGTGSIGVRGLSTFGVGS
ncbi:hypothetical protein ACFV1L_18365 [Kitasatospora sp. NPDC059646]|uniref:hypothetical protein n=1 Tax=Kitasatospora sp. NPDC059646 TaxID=3346893 RepID=UPI00369523C6